MKRLNILASLLIGLSMLLGACATATPTTAPTTAPTAVPTEAPTVAPTAAAPTTAAATEVAPADTTATGTPVSDTAIAMVDGLGRTVSLPGPVKRIVSLAPSNTELVYALGTGRLLVGRDDFSNYPAVVKDLPSVGGTSGYDLEAIVNLKPDLVLAAGINTVEQVKSMEDLGLNVFYMANPTDFNGLYQNIAIMGVLTGRRPRAADTIRTLDARVQYVQEKLKDLTDQQKPIVFYELDATDPSKPWTGGPGSFVDLLINMAGGLNAGGGLSDAWGQLSQEDLITANPDYIFLGDANYGITPESLAARPGWDQLKAVKENHVLTIDDDTVSRPTPRMVDALEVLAKTLHQDLFK